MKRVKSKWVLKEQITEYLQLNEICFLQLGSEFLPEFMLIIEGKVTWVELYKAKQLKHFSSDMVDNGCVYLIIDNIEQFKRIFISYVISEQMENRINE